VSPEIIMYCIYATAIIRPVKLTRQLMRHELKINHN